MRREHVQQALHILANGAPRDLSMFYYGLDLYWEGFFRIFKALFEEVYLYYAISNHIEWPKIVYNIFCNYFWNNV